MKNTTGVPQATQYTLGRGKLYAALLNTDGTPLAYRDLGNAPAMNLNLTTETLQHFSSMGGLKTVDAEVTISQAIGLSFQLEEANDENCAFFFAGETAAHTNVSVAGFTEFVMVADGKLEIAKWYEIVNSSGARAYDIDTSKLTIKTNEGSPVTLVLNTDYTVDADMGMFFLKASSTAVATAIGAGKGLKVTLTADAGAVNVDEVKAATKSSVIVALKFVSINPTDNNRKREFQFHKITLMADGDFSLIGEDWTKMPFKGTAQENTGADADSPTLTIRSLVN